MLPLFISSFNKVQGRSLEQGVIGFNQQNQISCGPGQMNTAFSWVKPMIIFIV